MKIIKTFSMRTYIATFRYNGYELVQLFLSAIREMFTYLYLKPIRHILIKSGKLSERYSIHYNPKWNIMVTVDIMGNVIIVRRQRSYFVQRSY